MATTIDTICRKDKINKRNEVAIIIRINHNGKCTRISSGIMVNADHWDFNANTLKPNTPNSEQVLFILGEKIQQIRKDIINSEIQGKKDILNSCTKKKKQVQVTIVEYFNQLHLQLIRNEQLNTASKYKATLSALQSFRNMNISFEDIDYKFLEDFVFKMKEKGKMSNSIATNLSVFKAVYNKAIEHEIFKSEINPFKKFKVGKLWTETRKRAITKEEINKLLNVDLKTDFSNSPYLEFSRDIFIFSYLAAGINFKDIALLKFSNINNDRLYYSRHKTRKNINCKLLPLALEIINKYNNGNYNEDNYIFPILDCNVHITEQQIFNRIKKVLRHINKQLKILAEKAGIKTHLTTYVSRHSYASNLKKAGVNIAIISESMGHSNLATTQIYLDSFENEQIDSAMDNLL